jgi:RNA polymerase sigma factor (sigma-70 family)
MSPGPVGEQADRELARLAAYIASRDERERAALLAEYDWVAITAARRFRDRGEPSDDLLQVARLGLIKALERFDPEAGSGFPAYGMATALGELRRHFRDATWRVYAPRAAKDLQSRLARETEAATHEMGRAPSVADSRLRSSTAVTESNPRSWKARRTSTAAGSVWPRTSATVARTRSSSSRSRSAAATAVSAGFPASGTTASGRSANIRVGRAVVYTWA